MPADTTTMHDHALKAEEHLEQLATGIASIPGVDDAAVKAVTQMAAATRKIAGMLAKGMRDEQPPAPPTTDEAIGAHMAQRRAAAVEQPPA